MSRKSEEIERRAEEIFLPVTEQNGFDLVDVEYVKEAGVWYLRVLLDKEGGVDILDCEAVSRTLSDLLDEADPIEGSYTLEVGSAGAERPLKRPGDFERFMGEAVLVKATNSTTLSFADNAAAPADPAMKGSATHGLRFAVAGGGHEDVAYALFDSEPTRAGADGLPKFAHLDAGLPSLSIVQGVNDYAIATFGKATESFPLKFSSKSKGEYTLTVDVEPWMGYLHLTDHATGREVDLLHQPHYTFTHEGGQAAARFTVTLVPLSQDDAIFAYQSGSSVVVKGEGELQVYDVMGRQLFANPVSTQLTLPCTQFPGTGVYVLRLGEKTQKLVIK